MRTSSVRRWLIAIVAVLGPLAAPLIATAHPLGNFTINHYAALRVGETRIDLDVVVDFAEIPAFQERLRIDADGDGEVSSEEAEAARNRECAALLPDLDLRVDGARLSPMLVGSGLSFPPGAGGVPTMRLVCELKADVAAGLTIGRPVSFADSSHVARIGWREVVVLGNGVTIAGQDGGSAPPSTDVSARLTRYPDSLLTQPLDVRSVDFTVFAGGASLPLFSAPDASPVEGPPTDPDPAPSAGVVPGGVGSEIPAVFRAADLTPIMGVGSILLALLLGAGHALTPGHGKTLMAAYLVGSRGTVRHAAGLGLAVTVSHTLGILLLAVLVTGAQSVLPVDVVVRTVPVVAAIAFVAIGGSMVAGEARRRASRRRAALAHRPDDPHDHDRDHAHDHGHAGDHGHDDATGREHHHAAGHDHAADLGAGEHSHGGIRHSHLPTDPGTITWRSLFALGLAGGIIPSTSALIILLGAIVAGRAAFGTLLVVAFGLGMAVVLGGVGAALVLARERLERLPTSSAFARLTAQAPLVASVVVLGIGIWMAAQALGGGAGL